MMSLKSEIILRVTVLFLASLPAVSNGASKDVNVLLDSLDKVATRRLVILTKKQSVIDDLKHGIADMPNDESLVSKYEQIFQEYLHFNGDSSIAYARKALTSAERTGQSSLILSAQFCLLRAYTRQGMMGKGYEVINQIGKIEQVPAVYRSRYADMLIDFSMRVGLYKDDIVPAKDAVEAWAQYSSYLIKDSPEYLFYQAVATGHGDIKKMEKVLAGLSKPSFMAANIYYALSLEYRREGKEENFYKNVISSAINDMLLGNTEVSSLISLLNTPLLECDLNRSSRYVKICSDNVSRYHDVTRALAIMPIQNRINDQLTKIRSQEMTVIIVIAVFFFIALVVSIYMTRQSFKRGKKVKRSLDALRVSHNKQSQLMEQQNALTEQLKDANSKLSGHISVYCRDFAIVYHLVSTYITHEKSMKVEIYNLLKANSVRKAIRLLESNAVIDNQLKSFYQHFDHAFLAINPEFIHRINSLLRPECRFDETQTELNTSLRIYALLVLGITDSVGIADFLHLSSQTVYNYRLKMRRCALGDEKQFDDDVINLYNEGGDNNKKE